MHYIRLLRPPSLDGSPSRPSLRLVLTITTDLGDSFLFPAQPISLSVLVHSGPRHDGASFTNMTPKSPPRWQAGMRVLKLDLPLPPGLAGVVQIRPTDQRLVASRASDVVASNQGGRIVPVYVELPAPGTEPPHVSSRRLELLETGAGVSQIEIQEEIGESIARHVWDAGIATVSVLADLHSPAAAAADGDRASLAWLKDVLSEDRELCVLELGCGVGILGIGIAEILRSAAGSGAAGTSVLMTDLAEAEECAKANISRHAAYFQDLDGPNVEVKYENLDWEDGKLGSFGPKVRSRLWDLVVLSDCTYNVDMLPTLVQTLSALHSGATQQSDCPGKSWETKVLLATKTRHSSEEALFGLMSTDGWLVREKAALDLPVLDAEAQSVEVYLFSKR